MKTIFVTGLFFLASAGMQSCTKCGYCETTTTITGSSANVSKGATVCGTDDYKAGKLNCERPSTNTNVTTRWVDDK